jgi:hypothetical protein
MTLRVGRDVDCPVCGRPKKPIGRCLEWDAEEGYCTEDNCKGYKSLPHADTLWPGEEGEEGEDTVDIPDKIVGW